MATNLEIVRSVDRIFSRYFVQANDIFMIALPWTFSPCLGFNPLFVEIMPSPWVITVVFSLLEPLATRFILFLSADPAQVRGLACMGHISAIIIIWDCILDISGVVLLEESSSNTARTAEDGLSKDQNSAPVSSWNRTSVTSQDKTRMLLVFMLAPLTSAFEKAAMLLSEHGLHTPSENTPLPGTWSYNLILFNKLLGIPAISIWTYFIEWIVYAKFTGRAKWLGGKVNGRSSFATQIGCLLLGLGIRFVLRMIMGIDPLLAFRPLNKHVRQDMQGTEILASIERLKGHWIGLLLIPIDLIPQIGLLYLVFWIRRRNHERCMKGGNLIIPVPDGDEKPAVKE